MRILYHHRTQGRGVEGVHIREMIRGWEKLDCNVDIVEPSGISALDINKKSTTGNKGAISNLYRYISRHMPEIIFEIFEIIYNVTAGKRLRKNLEDKSAAFFYERYALFNWCGVREAKRAKVPIILEINYTSHTPLYRKRNRVLKPIAHMIEKWVFKNADGFVAVSTYLKEHLLQLGVDKGRIIVLTNAADPDCFLPEEDDHEIRGRYNLNGKTVIGFVGGFYPWHGLDFLFEAFKTISRKNDDVVLFLVGDGPVAMQLKKDVADCGLDDKIVFPGNVEHGELTKYIASFDISVMPHSNEYGSPMKIYEYMAMSKPVVAPRFGPLEDGITHGVEGFLFKPGNVKDLALMLDILIKDKSLRVEIGASGRKRVLEKHNWKNNALSVIKFFGFHESEAKEYDHGHVFTGK